MSICAVNLQDEMTIFLLRPFCALSAEEGISRSGCEVLPVMWPPCPQKSDVPSCAIFAEKAMLAAGYNSTANAGISVNRDASSRLLYAVSSLDLSRSVAMPLTKPTTQWRKPKARISSNGCGHSSIKTLMNMWLQLTQMPTTSWSAPLTDLLDRSVSTFCSVLLFLITAR